MRRIRGGPHKQHAADLIPSNSNGQAARRRPLPEVELKLEGSAKNDGNTLLSPSDLAFCGIFRVKNVPQEPDPSRDMIEFPRLLFPPSRARIVADADAEWRVPRRFISIRSTSCR